MPSVHSEKQQTVLGYTIEFLVSETSIAFNDGMNIWGWNTFYIKIVLWTLLLLQQWKEPQQKPYVLLFLIHFLQGKSALRILVQTHQTTALSL